MDANQVLERLRAMGSPEAAVFAARYFKTGPGQYGEGDVFLGIRVGPLRQLARELKELPEAEVLTLLRSKFHEARLLALLILTRTATRGDSATRARVYDLYLGHTKYVNNWDLVDTSARDIVGGYLHDRDRSPLDRLTQSERLWERRIAVVATWYFIGRGEFDETLRIVERLLNDRHDLIHKAAGWMLREVGKRDRTALEGFLKRHQRTMPRTMLRYAIERFPDDLRRSYLRGEAE